jgi:hypothetical protein
MDNLSSNKKLDLILSSLKNYSQSISEIQDSLGFGRQYYQEIRMALDKLIKDGYVKEIKEELRYEGPGICKPLGGVFSFSYKLIFEGAELVKKGGYNKKLLRDILNKKELLKDILKGLIGAILGFIIAWLLHK